MFGASALIISTVYATQLRVDPTNFNCFRKLFSCAAQRLLSAVPSSAVSISVMAASAP